MKPINNVDWMGINLVSSRYNAIYYKGNNAVNKSLFTVIFDSCMTDTIPTQPLIERRPWGQFMQFTLNQPTTVKILTVSAGQQLSLQYHNHRTEQWYVLSGTGYAIIGDTRQNLQVGQIYVVPEQAPHRIHADTDVQILEVAFGVFDEQDIVRIEDSYGRIDSSTTIS